MSETSHKGLFVFSICLTTFLFVPFLLRLLGEEPYPAILLPSGATKISLSESYVFKKLVLEVSKNDGTTEHRDDLPSLILPLRPHFTFPVLKNRFGCDINQSSSRGLRRLGLATESRRTGLTEESVREAKKFMQKKLGPDAQSFRVFQLQMQLDSSTGKSEAIEKELLFEVEL